MDLRAVRKARGEGKSASSRGAGVLSPELVSAVDRRLARKEQVIEEEEVELEEGEEPEIVGRARDEEEEVEEEG